VSGWPRRSPCPFSPALGCPESGGEAVLEWTVRSALIDPQQIPATGSLSLKQPPHGDDCTCAQSYNQRPVQDLSPHHGISFALCTLSSRLEGKFGIHFTLRVESEGNTATAQLAFEKQKRNTIVGHEFWRPPELMLTGLFC